MLPAFNFDQLGFFLPAAGKLSHRTSRMKLAAGGRIKRAGHLPFQNHMFPFGFHNRIRDRDGRKQGSGIGMEGVPV